MIKELLKDLINPLADRLGVYDMLLSNLVYTRPGWTILMYHRVVPAADADPFRLGMCVQTERFKDQMSYVREHFTVITVAEGIKRLTTGKSLPRNALSITFDDAYLDFADHALPILRYFGFPSTLYAVTGDENGRRDFWWDRVIGGFARTTRDQITLEFLGDPPGPGRLSLKSSGRKKQSLLKVLDWLWLQRPAEIEYLVEQLLAALDMNAGDMDTAKPRHMDLESLARLDEAEVDVQAHSVTHPNFVMLEPAHVLREMRDSRQALEDVCNRPITGFAYPAGFQNRVTQQLAQEAGFEYAAGTCRGINRQPFDLYNLQRIGMPDSNVADLKRCLGFVAGRASHPVMGGFHSP